ncbi:MAG: T9SS type A sorting domain-containing protein [Bacteroidetes bacterium]|nr:T9SS type A sorting domain-containing protein [Bacteroidota bacterium]
MLRKSIAFIACFSFLSTTSFSQDWVNKLQDPTVNFYDVQKSFNDYWKKEEKKEKFKSFFNFKNKTEKESEGYVLYKRWEHFIEPRVYPSGDRTLLSKGHEELEKLIVNPAQRSSMMTGGNWTPLGAFTVPTNGGGAGRLNCVAFHPTNPNIIWVGSPAGGLWKSINAGLSWTTATDNLPTLGVNDIAIDPTNPNVMYIGTGDQDASDTYGVGVLKSIDGGISWAITGLNWTTNQGRSVGRLLINPNDHNMIFAATSTGVFKSPDAGITWTKVLGTGNIKDLEFKPGDPTVIYAASTAGFYKSVNTGLSFTIVSTTAGLPFSSSINRIAIGVSAANSSYVYLLYSASRSSSYKGLYLSTNSGTSFNLQSSTPNLFGWEYDGSDGGGQGWYTLSLDVSPVDASEVVVGGVNIWKSYNAGLDWNCVAHWWGDGGLPYVHADIHSLAYRPDGSELYATTDGGLYVTNDGASSWQDKSNGLQIGQMYRLGNSVTNANLVMQGWQDNGSSLYDAGAFNRVLGGDGMECFIDWSDPNYVYGEYQNGGLQGSDDGGNNFDNLVNNIDEPGQWVTPWMQDPVDPQTIYAGFENVWKSTNRGLFWTKISTFNSSGLIVLEVAKSNPLYIYAATSSTIYKTTDGGTTWSIVPYPSSSGSASITAIEVSTTNPNIIWLTRSGYTAGTKVFKSIDGGTNWTNLSGSLPNIPVNCVVNQTGTNDGVYVGTELGVYYIDNDLTSWMPYSNGLPNVIVDELEIHYGTNKLRAATYGRGLWESTIFDPLSNLPFANFAGDTLSGCPGFNVQFYDSTMNAPTAWSWSFPGGTPSTSNLQNPVVTYNTPGLYNNVTLVVTNAFGTDSVTKYSYIAVSPAVKPTITLSKNDTICFGQTILLLASNGSSHLWNPTGQITYLINVSSTSSHCVTVTDVFGCKLSSDTVDIYEAALPPIPSITISNDTLFSNFPTGNQWLNGGVIIPGATDSFYVLPWFGLTITLQQIDSVTGCFSTSTPFVGIDEMGENGISYSVYPNPSNGIVNLIFQSSFTSDVVVELTDVMGRLIYTKKYDSFNGREESLLDVSTYEKGVYLLAIKNSKGSVSKKVVVY